MSWHLPTRSCHTDKQFVRPGFLQIVWAAIGGFCGVGALTGLSFLFHEPLLIAPFAATTFLLYTEPGNPYSQPRNLLGAYLLCSGVGFLMAHFLGVSPLIQALAVGASIMAMELFRLLHPPATAMALVIMNGSHTYSFIFVPVLAGCVILILVSCVLNNLVPGRRYPSFW